VEEVGLLPPLHGPPILGLVGGIGSGKSAVAAELARQGAYVISGDRLGHEALEQPEIRERVVRRWGSQVLAAQEAKIDRGKLGRIVFGDPSERRALEELVHPYIERRFREEIEAVQRLGGVRCIVLDAALLFETNWNKMCSGIVYVHTPRSIRLERVASQRGWSAKEVEAREQAQLSLSEKASRADAALDNTGPPARLARQVADLLRRLADRPARIPALQIEHDTVSS
jgi:dephospho-CoA kinase